MAARGLRRSLLVLLVVLAGCGGDPGTGSGSGAATLDAALIEAARRGDAGEVRRLLEQGASVTAAVLRQAGARR